MSNIISTVSFMMFSNKNCMSSGKSHWHKGFHISPSCPGHSACRKASFCPGIRTFGCWHDLQHSCLRSCQQTCWGRSPWSYPSGRTSSGSLWPTCRSRRRTRLDQPGKLRQRCTQPTQWSGEISYLLRGLSTTSDGFISVKVIFLYFHARIDE